MNIDIVANPKRGCGTKATDSFYIEGGKSRNGRLQDAWCLGSHLVADGTDMWTAFDVPQRGVHIWNPAASLANRYFESEPYVTPHPRPFGPEWEGLVNRVGFGPALIDYVGAGNYTAKSFVRETETHGPSRKINRQSAIELAALMGKTRVLPIYFVTPLPVWTPAKQRDAIDFAMTAAAAMWDGEDEVHGGACWRHPEWGLLVEKYDGRNHFMAIAIEEDYEGTVNVDATKAAPCLFYVSWITRPPVWIAPTMDDARRPPDDVTRAGIRVGVLEDSAAAAELQAEGVTP